jgi:hypothetical protein
VFGYGIEAKNIVLYHRTNPRITLVFELVNAVATKLLAVFKLYNHYSSIIVQKYLDV